MLAQKRLPGYAMKVPRKAARALTLPQDLARVKSPLAKMRRAKKWNGNWLPRALVIRIIKASLMRDQPLRDDEYRKLVVDRVTALYVQKLQEVIEVKVIALLHAAVVLLPAYSKRTLTKKELDIAMKIIVHYANAKPIHFRATDRPSNDE